jgi:hypothetical protein
VHFHVLSRRMLASIRPSNAAKAQIGPWPPLVCLHNISKISYDLIWHSLKVYRLRLCWCLMSQSQCTLDVSFSNRRIISIKPNCPYLVTYCEDVLTFRRTGTI